MRRAESGHVVSHSSSHDGAVAGEAASIEVPSATNSGAVPAPPLTATILQAAPRIERGAGVAGVAFNLEKAFLALDVETERFTIEEAHGAWIPRPRGVTRKLALFLEVVWFSVVGGWVLRRRLRGSPNTIAICHNDALAGDIYVNHGVLKAAFEARGHRVGRVLRNPLHPFVLARDAFRYRSGVHRCIVALTTSERETLQRSYPRLRPDVAVIPNGVDTEWFSCGYKPDARHATRSALGLHTNDHAVLFVGHEFERKGLWELVAALKHCPENVVLVVVGGTREMVAGGQRRSIDLGVGGSVRWVGQAEDPRPFFAACDIFCLPSAYEANALVVLEAFAMGLPVVATPVGFAPDIVRDGWNGILVRRESGDIARGITSIVESPEVPWRLHARETGDAHSWSSVAAEYLALVSCIQARKRM